MQFPFDNVRCFSFKAVCFFCRLRLFWKGQDSGGVLSFTFVFGILSLAFAVGMGVDALRQERLRQAASNAADHALFAAATVLRETGRGERSRALAERLFREEMSRWGKGLDESSLSSVVFEVSGQEKKPASQKAQHDKAALKLQGRISARGLLVMPASLTGLLGDKKLTVPVSAEVVYGDPPPKIPIEIAIQLDNSTGMRAYMDKLKEALTLFVENLPGDNVRVALIPYSRGVNVQNLHEKLQKNNLLRHQNEMAVDVHRINSRGKKGHFDRAARLVHGCSAGPFGKSAYRDDGPIAGSPFLAYVREAGLYDLYEILKTDLGGGVTEYKFYDYQLKKFTRYRTGDFFKSADQFPIPRRFCSSLIHAPFTPLTNSRNTLISTIEAMTARDKAAASPVALAWTWYALSPHWKDFFPQESAPANYDKSGETVKKIAILMRPRQTSVKFCSDGFPGPYCPNEEEVDKVDRNPERLCSNMKAKGIEIYDFNYIPERHLREHFLWNDCRSSDKHQAVINKPEGFLRIFRDLTRQVSESYLYASR